MKKIYYLTIIGLLACTAITRAAIFTVINTSSDGPGSFSKAIRDADASPGSTIKFNIPGTGPFYIVPPTNGFPLITGAGTTVDGTSQPGWVANTAPITATNNAKIMIVLDAHGLDSGYYRDMAYVYYGTTGGPSDPPIDNSSMADPTIGGRFKERGGYGAKDNNGDGNSENNGIDTNNVCFPLPCPYEKGEVAVLGVYRAQNVTIKGLSILGHGNPHDFSDYAIAVAQDYGLDTTVHNVPNTAVGRWTYENGTCRGFHVNGCWFGVDPGTGSETNGSVNGISAYRHQDKQNGGTRPELPNCEGFVIGVEKGVANPEAQFNVFINETIGFSAEGSRIRLSGNQFIDAPPEIGRYDDTQIPAIVWGTDGDGVNDAAEGNLYATTTAGALQTHYHSGNKLWVFAGNYFGLFRDGTHTQAQGSLWDGPGFNERTQVRFGSDLDGVSDALEANQVFNTTGFDGASVGAPDATAWISLRGNELSNNIAMPLPEVPGTVYSKYMALPYRPVISVFAAGSLTVTYGVEIPAVVKRVFLDVYKSDPQGDINLDPEGVTYLGSFEDTSLGDGTVTWGAAPIASGDKITVAMHYARCLATSPVTISSITPGVGNVTITWSGTACGYDIERASSITGPWGSVGGTTGGVTTFTTPTVGIGVPSTAFYRIVSDAGTGGETSPFATSVLVP